MEEKTFRDNLIEFLDKGPAHLHVRDALANIKPENRHKKAGHALHTIWEELEHIRIAQEDILFYALDPDWKSPEWPEGYWPAAIDSVDDQTWSASIDGFMSDLNDIVALVNNPVIDLTAPIPHGGDHTYLREIMLIIDHNAYHLGKIVQLRKMLDDWKS